LSRIWFSADHHFGHANIIMYCARPFADTDEMDAYMVARWNERVAPDDVVWYLGDFAMRLEVALHITPLLNGTKHLIAGNHDRCLGYEPAHIERREALLAYGWSTIVEQMPFDIGSESVLLCHLPYRGHDPFAKSMACPVNEGRWLIHGHVHEKWVTKEKMINVGVDAWNFNMVSLDEIAALIARGPILPAD
jgi:calcineurin-like phosphoesterase family protein